MLIGPDKSYKKAKGLHMYVLMYPYKHKIA